MTVSTTNKWSSGFWVDLGERVGATFLGALATALALVEGTPIDWSDGQAVWTVLGVPVVFALIKGLLANLKDSESGASLVNAPPGPVVEDGVTNLLYAAGVALLLLALLLLVLKVAAAVAVSWLVVVIVAVVGVFLLFWGGRGNGRGVV